MTPHSTSSTSAVTCIFRTCGVGACSPVVSPGIRFPRFFVSAEVSHGDVEYGVRCFLLHVMPAVDRSTGRIGGIIAPDREHIAVHRAGMAARTPGNQQRNFDLAARLVIGLVHVEV